ncbi:MAG: 4Fe-4S dicluster domain-containing protein [Desulfobulbaceae bacterium]|uniref:4Fe-4S dicluster domain-containing protein n=1 Tax=Candidatus Desulfobia pelagia TaxID=2841692 RepID=A0A8J6NFU6_9BACT|nr:4Fe-4S dicluster domain-containing protein [Candidatus Desulfobia pelagia]
MQYAMVIDLNRCVGCHACTIACKAEWDVPADQGRNWVRRLGPSNTPHGLASTYYPGLCNHCNEPPCVEICPADTVEMTFTDVKTNKTKTMEVAATWKDPFDGTVQIDKERCIGCGACADACPYGARYVNPDLGEDGKADKCTFCKPRVDKGLEPSCVQTCLADARIFGDLNDPKSAVSEYVKKGAKGLTSAAVNIGPNVLYFGNQKDDHLLRTTSTPTVMPEASLRRSLLARMKPEMKKIKNLGLLGLAGAVLAHSMDEDK